MKKFETIFLVIILLTMLVMLIGIIPTGKESELTSGEAFLASYLFIIHIILIFIFGYLIIIGKRIKSLSSKKLETPSTPHTPTQTSSQKRNCPRCKAECDIEDDFCIQCGEKLIKS